MKMPLSLVVDDAPDLHALIARALPDDYEVRSAASGAQARAGEIQLKLDRDLASFAQRLKENPKP